MIEKRTTNRHLCVGTVYYTDGPDAEIKTARCSDVGPSGMCIFTSKPIPPGSFIKISMTKKTRELRAATVRWCEKLGRSLYREGVSHLK